MTSPNEHKIKVTRTARYFTRGKISDKTENVWFLLHGYGQLANNFLDEFGFLDPAKNFLVAPEALSRFYLSARHGTIGASWMTKEDRFSEIEDYQEYLDSVYNEIIPLFDRRKIKFNLLGFSQGSATAGRWALLNKPDFDNLIFWAGDLPEDNLITESKIYIQSKNIFAVIGNQDRIINIDRVYAQADRFKEFGKNISLLSFEGGHEINPGCLKEIIIHAIDT